MKSIFITEVHQGLSSTPKTLPSKYFYNKKGDALFVEIMNLPEYYLTLSELDIFQNKTQELIEALGLQLDAYFELIELGAGDGTKTKELLKVLDQKKYNFDYFPIDISANALELLKQDLNKEIPNLNVQTRQGDYFEILASLKMSKKPKIVMFLGSNIGNMNDELASKFIYNLGSNLQTDDKLLLGVDLIKAKDIVLPAYNDCKGVTAKFNLNLLDRINNELGGNFKLDKFKHQPEYTQKEGIAKSFLVSTTNQTVKIQATERMYSFTKGEKIHTEISRKYNDTVLNKIIANTDFEIQNKIMDSKAYFADYILKRN
ncbi:MAG: L-histidine N(alpha)-methyltransferase [Maribacter sp.]|uniref:L-histidine N(alpha)-methyltransferase n=1 Tax=Maribacter sp. TaxID=1897614 RepID=UPI003C757B87